MTKQRATLAELRSKTPFELVEALIKDVSSGAIIRQAIAERSLDVGFRELLRRELTDGNEAASVARASEAASMTRAQIYDILSRYCFEENTSVTMKNVYDAVSAGGWDGSDPAGKTRKPPREILGVLRVLAARPDQENVKYEHGRKWLQDVAIDTAMRFFGDDADR